MVFPQKRVLIFLFAAMVLAASPALSVPLSSGVESPGAAAYGTPSYTDPDGETTLPADGTAGIVDHQTVATNESHATEEASLHPEMGMGGASTGIAAGGGGMPGWMLPAAGIGAGGAAIAVLAHGNGNGSAATAGGALGGMGSGGGIGTVGTNDGTPGGSSDVPEPGTIMLMGAGIASFLARRRLFSK